MLARLRWATVDGEAVVVIVDGPPVLEVHLEGSFNFPVLDQVLHNLFQTSVGVIFFFGCSESSVSWSEAIVSSS